MDRQLRIPKNLGFSGLHSLELTGEDANYSDGTVVRVDYKNME